MLSTGQFNDFFVPQFIKQVGKHHLHYSRYSSKSPGLEAQTQVCSELHVQEIINAREPLQKVYTHIPSLCIT